MESFRNPDFVERYEDVVFDLETPITLPGNNAEQKKGEYRLVADNSGEVAPFDWYNARIIVNFKVNKKSRWSRYNSKGLKWYRKWYSFPHKKIES